MSEKDVHTEHCCIRHGCKYGTPFEQLRRCTVESGEKKQSFSCEQCWDEIAEVWSWAHLMNEMFERGRSTPLPAR